MSKQSDLLNLTDAISVSGTNVGIGTSSPAFALDVNHASDNGLARFSSGDADAYITISDVNSSSAYNKIGVITHDMYFNTNNSERMRIDSAGRVTMPYQPSFRAYLSASVAAGNIVLWSGTFHNTGSHFSTATGRFTAPVSGVYQINLHYLSANDSNQSSVYIRVNGLADDGARVRSAVASGHETTSVCHAISLSAGDYVDVENGGAGFVYGDSSLVWSEFSGHLIG